MQEFEELPTIEEFIAQNKRSPPKIRIIVRASHIESREVLKEYAPFERDFFKKEYYWIALIIHCCMMKYIISFFFKTKFIFCSF